jgi:alcohol dehydrogenase class IV
MGADIVILDPNLTISTPQKVWLSTGVRSVDHCIEAFCSDEATKESDETAANGLKLLVPSLLNTNKDWENERSRLKEMMGVVEAMKALDTGVPMGGSHGIGHQLGPLGVEHGETSCILLPSVLKWTYKRGNKKVKARQQKILDILWSDDNVAEVLASRGLDQDTADAGDVIDAIVRELGMPRTLAEVGIKKEQLDELAENCLKDPWLQTNAVPITKKEQVLEILNMAFE